MLKILKISERMSYINGPAALLVAAPQMPSHDLPPPPLLPPPMLPTVGQYPPYPMDGSDDGGQVGVSLTVEFSIKIILITFHPGCHIDAPSSNVGGGCDRKSGGRHRKGGAAAPDTPAFFPSTQLRAVAVRRTLRAVEGTPNSCPDPTYDALMAIIFIKYILSEMLKI